MRTVDVVAIGVLGQYRFQLPTSEDQHPIQQLTSNGPHPSLRIGVRPWRPYRRDEHLNGLGREDSIERGGELGVASAEHKPEPAKIVFESHDQVSGLLRHPLPHRLRGHPEHMDLAGAQLHDE
jgi:hypothetical protein